MAVTRPWSRALWIVAGTALLAVAATPLVVHFAARPSTAGPVWDRWLERRAIILAFVPYGVALLAARRHPIERRTVLIVASAAGALLLGVTAVGSRDIYSYLFYGRMASHAHLNPLATDPSRLASDPWYALVGWRHTPSVYGPVWTYVSAAASLLWPHVLAAALALKLLAVAGAGIGCSLASRMVSDDRDAQDRALILMVWNPLLLFSVAGDGHVDGVLIGLIVGALAARRRDRAGIATALLVVATLVKVYSGLFLALHLAGLIVQRRRSVRAAAGHAAAAAAAMAAAYAPLWAGRATFDGVREVGGFFDATLPSIVRSVAAAGLRVTGSAGPRATADAATIARGASIVALVVCLCFLVARYGRTVPPARMWAAGFAAYLLAATWFVPWHALPLLPLAAVDARDARGRAFLAAVVAFSFTSMFAVVPVRFGVPLAVGLVAAYGAPRLRRAFAPSTA